MHGPAMPQAGDVIKYLNNGSSFQFWPQSNAVTLSKFIL